MNNAIVGTAGHIDHGKTALIQALTGIDADRLKEEKLRGITIDLGFAHLFFPDLRIGFIDVPGHERFVHNMLAGIGGIDLVMLVVSGDESVMPQTREHFEICRLLGIQGGLIAITKADLVDTEMIELVEDEVQELVQGSFLEGAPMLRVSSKTGLGIPELKEALYRLALHAPSRAASRSTRLPVDRVFTVKGFGTVVTGTLLAGTLHRDQEVEFLPVHKSCRIRNLHTYGESVQVATAGQRVAVNIQGLEVSEIERGMILAETGSFLPSLLLDVRVELLENAPSPLKHLGRVHLHIGSHELLARVALFEGPMLAPGGSGLAQLRLEEPAIAAWGDRFILRRFSPLVTIGGGMVLHSHPPKLRRPAAERATADPRFAQADDATRLLLDLEWAGSRGRQAQEISATFGFNTSFMKELAAGMEQAGSLAIVGRHPLRVVSRKHLSRVKAEMLQTVRDYHQQNALASGLPKEELRQRLLGGRDVELFAYLVQELAEAKKITLQGEVISLFGHRLSLKPEEEDIKRRIETSFRSAGLSPASASEMMEAFTEQSAAARSFYHLLLKEGRLVKISEDLTLHCDAVDTMKLRLREAFLPGNPFNVGQFKDLFGLSRKFAIPLLEYLDRHRITRRVGDNRVVQQYIGGTTPDEKP